MKLSAILSQVKTPFQITGDPSQIEVEDIAIDSRLVKKNSVFFALPGKATNGEKFIDDAIQNGASLIVSTSSPDCRLPTTDYRLIASSNPSQLLAEFLKILYHPLPTNIYAITGTNGKTSTAEFTRQILEFLGKKSASIGTLGVSCAHGCDGLQNSSLTTPDIVSLYKNLSTLKKNGINDVAIEVSSIGLEQGRIAGLEIAVGAFTNFTQDHLDYHKSMDEYFACKMLLFSSVLQQSGCAVLNADIPEFSQIKKICDKRKLRVIEYGRKASNLKLLEVLSRCVKFEFRKKIYEFELLADGDFQAFNALCALGGVLAKNDLGEDALQKLLTNFSALSPAPGRMQQVATLTNGAKIFIDFAHSPDALKNVLLLARGLTKKRVVVLFGCGGDRDAKKRPLMGAIASELADLVIVSDDNPRSEDAQAIREQILAACLKSKTLEIANRKVAIEKSITLLEAGDVLILAGKGHEKYQIIGSEKFEFDEEKIVKNAIERTS